MNNPLKYTDPTGHMQYEDTYARSDGKCGKGDTSCNWVGKTKKPGKVYGPPAPCTRCHHVDQKSISAGFYVGSNTPKILADRAEDIYEGTPVDLIDSLGAVGDDLHYSPDPNVMATLYYQQNRDGSVNVTSMTITNSSDYRIFVDAVQFESKQTFYMPNPLRYTPQMNSDHFLTIDSGAQGSMPLVPSGNPQNPSNQFSPADSPTVYITFSYVAPPSQMIVTFNLLP